ncbi:hypothetical protein D3C80_657690 [compost metagenome]
MLSRGRDESYAFDTGFLPPIQLPDLGRRHAPGDQDIAHAQGGDEMLGAGGQLAYGLLVEMIEVIVGKDDGG